MLVAEGRQDVDDQLGEDSKSEEAHRVLTMTSRSQE